MDIEELVENLLILVRHYMFLILIVAKVLDQESHCKYLPPVGDINVLGFQQH